MLYLHVFRFVSAREDNFKRRVNEGRGHRRDHRSESAENKEAGGLETDHVDGGGSLLDSKPGRCGPFSLLNRMREITDKEESSPFISDRMPRLRLIGLRFLADLVPNDALSLLHFPSTYRSLG